MRLTREQSQKLLRERGIWITEACDKCGRLLGSVRYTRKDEPGEYCSAQCRDGVNSTVQSATSGKACRECGASLRGKRADSEFCGRAHLMRHRRKSQTSQNPENSGNRRIQKQRLTERKIGPLAVPGIPATEGLETSLIAKSAFEEVTA